MGGGTTKREGAFWIILWTVLGVALVAELVLLFLLPAGSVRWLRITGFVLFGLSAVFGWLPIFFFRRHGGVAKGKSYMHTTALVTRGPYAIIRHPQYLACDLLALAIICILQHWSAIVAGVLGIAANHLTILKANRDLIDKFGDDYREYRKRVPGTNLILGLWRWMRRASRMRPD
jgi:protein-S-isoprenylcysteine O-methyltransferase Ste14